MSDLHDEIDAYGDYRVVREIGRGGMGVVYEVEHRTSAARYAIKVLPADRSRDPKVVSRFQREAEAARRLSHPNIIGIYDFARERDLYYFVMDLIPGRNLEDIIFKLRRRQDDVAAFLSSVDSNTSVRGEVPADFRSGTYIRTILRLIADVADALFYAHENGLIHRDLKPSNLILSQEGRLVLTDFGLVRDIYTHTMTLSGEILGTPLYMSPEQIAARRKSVDARTDIYSLGITLYEALSLEAPYTGQNLPELVQQIQYQHPQPLTRFNPAVPREVENIIGRAIAKIPSDRYSSMKEFSDDIRRFLAGGVPLARPPSHLRRLWTGIRLRPEMSAAWAAIFSLLFVVGVVIYKAREGRLRQERQDVLQYVTDSGILLEQGAHLSAWRTINRASDEFGNRPEIVEMRARIPQVLRESIHRHLLSNPKNLDGAVTLVRQLNEIKPDEETRRLWSGVEDEVLNQIRVAAREGNVVTLRAITERARDFLDSTRTSEFETLLEVSSKEVRQFSIERALEFLFSEASTYLECAEVLTTPESDLREREWISTWRSRPYAEFEGFIRRIRESSDSMENVVRDLLRPTTFVRLPRAEVVRFVRMMLNREVHSDVKRLLIDMCRRLRLDEATPDLLSLADSRLEFRPSIIDAFSAIPDRRATSFLLSCLDGSPDSSEERSVLAALSLRPDPSVISALRRYLSVESLPLETANLVAFVLGKLGAVEAADEIVNILGRYPPAECRMALEALAQLKTPLENDTFQNIYLNLTNPEDRALMLRLTSGGPGTRGFLLSILKSNENERLSAEAARALSRLPDAEVLGDLIGVYRNSAMPPAARAFAAIGLGELGREEAQRALIDGFAANTAEARQAAVLAMTRYAASHPQSASFDAAVATLLSSVRNDVSDDVRAAAVYSLAQLKVHWSAEFIVRIVNDFEPDMTSDVIRNIFGTGRSGGAALTRLIETYGTIGVLVPGVGAFLSGENALILAACDSLGMLAGLAEWKDSAARQAAIGALFRLAGKPNLPIRVARTIIDALGNFRPDVDAEAVDLLLRRHVDVDVLSTGALVLARMGRHDAADLLWNRLFEEMRADDCYRKALSLVLKNRFDEAAEWLAKAMVLGYRDSARWRDEPDLRPLAGNQLFELILVG